MKLYKRKTKLAIKRFLRGKEGFAECVADLDALLADFIPRLQSGQIAELRSWMLANNEIVMKEMERRGPPPPRA